MIKFDEYYYLKEDPDTVYIDTDELSVNVEEGGTDDTVYGFGFLNTNILYKNIRPFEKMQDLHSELVMGRGLSHGYLKRLFFQKLNKGIIKILDRNNNPVEYDLSNPDQHQEFMNSSFREERNARIMFSPSGRIWTIAINQVDKKPVVIISFWCFKNKEHNKESDPTAFGDGSNTKVIDGYEVTSTHIKRILNKAGVPRDQWYDTYLEFLDDEYKGPRHRRITFREFTDHTPPAQPVQKSKEEEQQEEEMVKQGQEKIKIGAHKNKLNPDFGSPVQAKKAKKAGVSSYAEYKAKRNPYGESTKLT
jgi:hypothetical protein